MSGEFHAYIFEGVFGTLQSDGVIQHWVQTPEGEDQRIDEKLTELVGRTVQIAAHHLPTPPTPKDPSKWRQIVVSGQLGHDPERGVYTITGFDGSTTELDLMIFCGCAARVLVATTDAIEQARDVVVDAGLADRVEGLGKTATDLQSLLGELTKIAGERKP